VSCALCNVLGLLIASSMREVQPRTLQISATR
jgi:hypothetical protein